MNIQDCFDFEDKALSSLQAQFTKKSTSVQIDIPKDESQEESFKYSQSSSRHSIKEKKQVKFEQEPEEDD